MRPNVNKAPNANTPRRRHPLLDVGISSLFILFLHMNTKPMSVCKGFLGQAMNLIDHVREERK